MSLDLSQVLDSRAVCLDVEAADADAVIALLAARLEAIGAVRPSYGPAVQERERTMPTGLALGAINVAVPHTDAHHVLRPAVALAVLRAPVDFGSMDDPDDRLPVRIVLALALNDKHAQIAMLQAVAGMIQTPALLQSLLDAPDIPAALALLRAMNKEDMHGQA